MLILPEASLDAVHVNASLCTQGDINEALLYATVAIVGTHAAVWTIKMSEPGPTEWGVPAGGVGPWAGPLPDDPRYDPELLRDGDTRNVVDAYRYWTREAIVADIDNRRHPLHVAIENFGHDANIGGVVRTANAFAVDTVHIVGRRRWNRRGAMVTDRYQRLRHHDNTAELLSFASDAGLTVVAVDIVPGAARLEQTTLPRDCLLLFGQEGPGISDDARDGRRVDRVDRPVRVDAQHQRRGRGRDRHAYLDQPTRGYRQAGTVVGQDQQTWIRYGSTGRSARKPLSPAGI